MGYSTDFDGSFKVTPALTPEQVAYLQAFNRSRRMKRNAEMTVTFPDTIREAVGLPVGIEGAYYVGASGSDFGQERTPDILDYNNPPTGQPGLWCQWTTENGESIKWDGGEKFYDYAEWLTYIVDHFLKPWGRMLNGEVRWRGEDFDDIGTIIARNGTVSTTAGW